MEVSGSGSSTFLTKETFLRMDFNPDTFIAEQRKHMPLESLRNELSMFLKVINASVVELINRDYADFLNLSSHLLSVENLLSGIQQPTEQLRLQVEELGGLVKTSIDEMNDILNRKTAIEQQRRNCERLRELIDTEKKLSEIQQETEFKDSDQFYRIASLLEKAHTLHEVTKKNVLSRRLGERVRVLASKFDTELDAAFRSGLASLSTAMTDEKSKQDSGKLKSVLMCLHCYAVLNGGEKRVESIFRDALVNAALSEFVNEAFVEKQGVDEVYSRILQFCTTTLGSLQQALIGRESSLLAPLTVIRSSTATSLPFRSVTQQFDFVVYAFAEFVSKLDAPRGGVSSLFGIADPDAFQRSYATSLAFLDRLESLIVEQSFASSDMLFLIKRSGPSSSEADDQKLEEAEKQEAAFMALQRFRQSAAYLAFMSKWNLFVYFELRFQTIASKIEQALSNVHEPAKSDWLSNSDSGLASQEFQPSLAATQTLVESVCRCWSDGVYLDALASKFWKLTLQLNSRYATAMRSELGALKLTSAHTPFGAQSDNLALHRALRLLNDVWQLSTRQLRLLHQNVVQPRLVAACASSWSSGATTSDGLNDVALEEAVGEQCDALSSIAAELRKTLVDYVASCGCIMLKQTSEIPRLFRKTNRAAPTRASAHVTDALDVLQRFQETTRTTLADGTVSHELIAKVANELCSQFATIASDLLDSVRKTEETLKRLKRSRTTQASLQNAALQSELSDDDKIRMQLALDMTTFVQKLESELHLDSATLSELQKLTALADALQQQLRAATE